MGQDELPAGLYDEILTASLARLTDDLGDSRRAETGELRAADAADRLADHVARAVSVVLAALPDDERVVVGASIVAEVLALLVRRDPELAADLALVEPAMLLRGIAPRRPDGSFVPVERPFTPLVDTTILANAPGEPTLSHELRAEIPSAHRIDVLMAFVRFSGIFPMLQHLERHVDKGGRVRLLTTTYTGSTESRALEALEDAGVEVRVSYDESTTRLHAKSWMFHRARGNSTAYVGSSNLTHSAMAPGLEWNVRLSGLRNPEVVARMSAIFESYWEGDGFVPFAMAEFRQRTEKEVSDSSFTYLPPTDLVLRPFQERLVEQIEVAREHGRHRNLLVAATGTGKTVMAAVDYARLRPGLDRARLLFVAHRREILEQSRATFRHALRDASFGELWVGGERPQRFEAVFASIQSLSASGVDAIDPGHFDVVIVDEFHHAAAPTYAQLLERLSPTELLGLTATPERADGLDVVGLFDGQIAAELRLWDAIDQQHLVPFAYYGIHDGLDLRDVPFQRGIGYDVGALTNVYTGNDVWVGQLVEQLRRRVADPREMRALGFCVSVEHARFMAQRFVELGIPARAVWGESTEAERADALRDLRDGELAAIFAVDLFNEGVDVPTIDTLLLLRPTESATLFLQQLGRGLRRAPGKSVCTVLDFVGTHRREFRFDLRYRALLGGTRSGLESQVKRGFPFLPSGCHLELDPVAERVVLDSLRSAIPSNWPQRVAELKAIGDVDLATFLRESGLELDDVYANGRSWTDLRRAAGFASPPTGEVDRDQEKGFLRAIGRLLHVDDDDRHEAYARFVSASTVDVEALGERERRLLRMLLASMFHRAAPATLAAALAELRRHEAVCAELVEALAATADRVTHLQPPFDGSGEVPLRVHARYSRLEIQAAFGDGEGVLPPRWDSGVKWLPSERTDLFAFTLDKSSGDFSPTTRYRDYAISRDLIHWESQSTTSLASPTGQRYVGQATSGTTVALFGRLRSDDRSYWCLGPATYVSHEGERPIAITWRLDHRLPGDLFTEFAAAAVA